MSQPLEALERYYAECAVASVPVPAPKSISLRDLIIVPSASLGIAGTLLAVLLLTTPTPSEEASQAAAFRVSESQLAAAGHDPEGGA